MPEQVAPRKRGRPRKESIVKAAEPLALTKGPEGLPPIKFGETGFNGLKVIAGRIFEECNHELRWPQSIQTYKKMSKDGTIAPALNLVEMAIARVPWKVVIPEGYEEELKEEAEFLRQCMNDMDHSWGSFIRQVVSFNRYGFSVHEIVLRNRYKRNGSKYDDGLVGFKRLPIRAQDTISSWDWTNDGRELSGLYQCVVKPTGKDKFAQIGDGEDVFIPRKKFLLFRNNPLKDNPESESPLAACYMAWKFKTELERFEATAVATDVRGLKVLKLNPRYLDPNASDEDKQVYEYYQQMMRNLHLGEQSGVILPSLKDERGEEQIADLELLSITGQKSYDTNAIIARYKQEIITTLMASQLVLGQNGGGSFSLAESLNGISQMAIEARLIEIKDVLNHQLVPMLFKVNGWDTTVLPEITYGDLSTPDLDVLSKFLQRVASVGLIADTPQTVNWIAAQANMPVVFDDVTIEQEEARKMLTGYESGAGEGQQTAGPGTSNGPAESDNSVSNQENA